MGWWMGREVSDEEERLARAKHLHSVYAYNADWARKVAKQLIEVTAAHYDKLAAEQLRVQGTTE